MFNIKKTFIKAIEEIKSVYGDHTSSFRIEEFEKDSNTIVISFLLDDEENQYDGILPKERIFKKIVFSKNGELNAIKVFTEV